MLRESKRFVKVVLSGGLREGNKPKGAGTQRTQDGAQWGAAKDGGA